MKFDSILNVKQLSNNDSLLLNCAENCELNYALISGYAGKTGVSKLYVMGLNVDEKFDESQLSSNNCVIYQYNDVDFKWNLIHSHVG